MKGFLRIGPENVIAFNFQKEEVHLESTSMVHFLDEERRREKYPRKQLKIMKRFLRFYEDGIFDQIIHMATDSVDMTKHLRIMYHRIAKDDGDRSNFGRSYPVKDEKPNRTHEHEWLTASTTTSKFVKPDLGKSTNKAEFKTVHPDDVDDMGRHYHHDVNPMTERSHFSYKDGTTHRE